MTLAEKIINLRKQKGWSQEELAERLDVTRQSVSKGEGGQSMPDIVKILQISELFGVTTDYLLKDNEEAIESEMPPETEKEEKGNVRLVEKAEAEEYLSASRAAAGKFADTPRGVFPLKFFFPSGGAAELSNQAVLEKIKSLIAEEDPAFPLSDDSIADMLKKDGVSIARRTVAKYRDMLKIPSASKRKER